MLKLKIHVADSIFTACYLMPRYTALILSELDILKYS